jgi:voltage-gated potassium channel
MIRPPVTSDGVSEGPDEEPVATVPADDPAGQEVKATGYELFALLVSILSIGNLFVIALPGLGPAAQVALVVEVALTPVFLIDFLYRLGTSTDRRRYFVRGYGWADFLAIPPFLSVFRLFRIGVTVRGLRRRGFESVGAELDRNRASTTFFFTVFLVIAVVEFAGMAELLIEHDAPGSNIHTASDALWWGFVTIATVGYGDKYPTTNPGRIVGTAMLFAGVALFSVLTGFIANAFLAPRRRRRRQLPEGSIEADIAALHALIDEHEAHASAIRHRLEELERKAVGGNR